MLTIPPASPLRGRYLVRNLLPNRLLACCDALLGRLVTARKVRPVVQPRRVLLANGAHLGDVLLATSVLPVLRAAFPAARLGFLAGSWARPVVDGHPLLDRVHVVDHWKLNRSGGSLANRLRHYWRTRATALQEIRDCGYDIALDLYYFFPNSIPLLWQAGVQVRIGYTSGGFGPLLTHALDWHNGDRPVTAYQADLLRELAVSDEHLRHQRPSLPPGPPGTEEAVTQALRPLSGADSYLVLHPGTGNAVKEWPLDKWRSLAARLHAAGYALVCTGSTAAERRQGDQVLDGLSHTLNLCGRLSWHEFVAVVGRARLLVGVDSVAGHVAAAVETPCVVVYSGVTNPPHWRPAGASRVLTHAVPCAPCYRSRGCATMDCVRDVTVDEVFVTIREELAAPRLKDAG